MIRHARAPLLVLVSLLVSASAVTQSRLAEVERLAAEGHTQSGAPGMSVAVVVDNRLAWSQGFGFADVENEVPARANTVYRIASISKPIAATAVMQLAERGRVNIDDAVQKYVPAFPEKGEQVVTVRHLLTHTSGIRQYRAGEMESRDRYETAEDALRIFKDDPLLFAPGTKYSYSTYGYNVLAGVVEKASGLGVETYLRTHVWGPAGMTATYFDHASAVIPRRARQYVRAGRSLLNAPYADLSNKWAGGGMLSTAEDLVRFHIALEEGTLLKPETLRQMYAPYRLKDGSETTYGLRWASWKDARGRAWIGHSGGATGGTTFLVRDPARRVAVAVLCNVERAEGLGALAERIAAAAENAAAATPSGRQLHPSTSVK
jgi:serine beta-lactamase-like protein LACTB, mitochondrial